MNMKQGVRKMFLFIANVKTALNLGPQETGHCEDQGLLQKQPAQAPASLMAEAFSMQMFPCSG